MILFEDDLFLYYNNYVNGNLFIIYVLNLYSYLNYLFYINSINPFDGFNKYKLIPFYGNGVNDWSVPIIVFYINNVFIDLNRLVFFIWAINNMW